MSTTVISADMKKCATCDFWTGWREGTNHFYKQIRVEVTGRGKCTKRRIETGSLTCACNQFCQWGVLKKNDRKNPICTIKRHCRNYSGNKPKIQLGKIIIKKTTGRTIWFKRK